MRLYRRGPAAKLELNRPERLNAWNDELGLALRDTVLDLAADDSVRAVLITGAGRAFSSGADLRDRPARQPGRPSGHLHGADRAVSPDHHRDPVDAEARGRGGQRRRGRHRPVPRAVLRPGRERGVGLLRAGLRQRRPGPDGGSSLLVPSQDRVRQGRRAGDARLAPVQRAGSGLGPDQPGLAGRRADAAGRRASCGGSRTARRARTRAPSGS